nr:movement protein [Lamium mild mosaic virus]
MHLLALWFYFISVLACSYTLIWKYCVVPILQTHIDNFRVEESKHAFYFRQRLWVPYWKKVYITLFSLQYHTDWEAYDKFHAQVEEAIARVVEEKKREKMSQQSKAQDYTATESAPITPGHTLPKDLLLAKAQAYRTATAGNESVLPQVSDLYQAHFLKRALGKFHEDMPTYVRTGELVVGKVYGDGTGILEVPVVPHNTEQIVDYRLKEKERKKGQQVMVAAVEIQADGFASNSSTTTMAAALFDKRHSLVANSFKGSFASAASGVPTHVVFYPSLRIAPGDDPNEVLTLSTVSRDTDFDDNYTLAEFTARTVYVKARGPDKIKETKNLIFSSNLDRVKAHQFADETRCVVSTPRVNPAVDLTNYKMPTPFGNLVRTEGIYSADGSILFPKARQGHNPEIVLNYTGPVGKSRVNAKKREEVNWQKTSRSKTHDFSESEDDMDSYEGQAATANSSTRRTIPLNILHTELCQSLLDSEEEQDDCDAHSANQEQIAFGQ